MAQLFQYLAGPPGGARRQSGRTIFPKASPFPRIRPMATYQPLGRTRMPKSPYFNPNTPDAGQSFATSQADVQNQQAQNQTANTALSSPYQSADASSFDPILSQIQALSSKSVAEAHSHARDLRDRAAIQSGDPALLTALGFDPNTINAASQNPESLMAQLGREYAVRQRDVAEANSAANTIYGGHYVNDLKTLAENRASAEGQVGSRLRDLLSGIDQNVLDAENQARDQQLQAELQQASQGTYSDYLNTLMNALGNQTTDTTAATDNTGAGTTPTPTPTHALSQQLDPMLMQSILTHLAASAPSTRTRGGRTIYPKYGG